VRVDFVQSVGGGIEDYYVGPPLMLISDPRIRLLAVDRNRLKGRMLEGDHDAQPGASAPLSLDPASVDAIAFRLAEILRERSLVPRSGLLTAAEVASRYGVKRGWVYDNATRLGAIRLGRGSRARLRFDPDRVGEQLDTIESSHPPYEAPKSSRWLPEADLIPIRGK
jgi:hypothetical protein